VAHRTHDLGWQYVVFDVPALRAHLDEGLADVAVHAARMSAEQTAFGVVVPAVVADPLVPAGEALFMDWRPDHGEDGWPTFLYGIPIGEGEVLLEETSLARRPGLPVAVLRRRLHARLAHYGIPIPPEARTETVRFPVDRPRHDVPGVLGFGAAAPLVHPATGFSLAAALGLAEPVADRARGAAADAAGRGARVLRRLLRPTRGPALGLPHRSRRPVRHGRHDNGALSGVRVAVASAARRSGGAAPAARQRRAGRAVTYTPVSTLRTLPSGSSNHALLTSS
jgi:lycopene beta-cyclase